MTTQEQVDRDAAELERLWDELLPELIKPDQFQFERWATIFTGELPTLKKGFYAAAKRLRKRAFNDPQHPVAFISGVANNLRRAAKQTPLNLPETERKAA